MNKHAFIPFHVPSIGEEEIEEVADTLRSGWITTGPKTARFEADFARYLECRHTLAVNSATAGMHLALAALGLGPGDEVITTPLTFCATANVIIQVGATPVLADVGSDGNIDPASIAERITPRTKALLPVHLAGKPCDMDAIWALAERDGLRVIEDAAHATETQYRGLPLASERAARQSDAVAFSFYATKNLTTGEGGMVATNDAALAERMRVLCLHGISKDAWNRYAEKGKWYYQVLESGFKYNLGDIQSSIGIHQLRKLEGFAAARRRLVEVYREELAEVDEVELPEESAEGRHAWHLFAIRLRLDKLRIDRAEFMAELQRQGVGASVHFIPLPLHPFFARWADRPENQCPRALAMYERLISLPLYPALAEEQVREVARKVRQIVARQRRARPVLAAVGD
ncbi:MAG TPA: DegT/DnrJ/EryC1/StrS aminotransferase family protein [Bryobacteraceae bacterium]|nr:DegT/DnrJ/EryC1/StrS aminotransferase family protein [Bryobacteraceae bacterium]